MKSILIIARREIASYFDSLMAYIVIILFLLLTGFFTWLWPNNVFYSGQADLGVFFFWVYFCLFLLIPAITMKTIAEEKSSGTLEILTTKAINEWDIVIGKYLSVLAIIAIAIACTLPYYFSVAKLGNVDHGSVIGGYIGILLYSSAFIALGVFSSSLTNNQIIAFLLAFAFMALFSLVFWALGNFFRGTLGSVVNFLSARTHYDSISRGLIDSRDVLYFMGLTFLGLLFSQAMLSKRNWRD